MGLPSLSLRRPVFAIVMNVMIVLFGIIGYKFLGVREYPAIDPPVITVRTNYTGANADIIESQITEPLENAINGVQGIRTISSASNQGSSNITVEFELSADLETAANDVRDKVSQAVRLLPQDIDAAPVVSKADANSDAIISMTVQSETKSVLELTDYAVNVLQQRLQTIPDVSTVQIWGQKNYAMRLWFDPIKLAAYQITAIDIQNALNANNVELPSGKIVGSTTEITVNSLGRLNTTTEFDDMIIKDTDGQKVRLKDIGYSVLGTENFETSLKESAVAMVALAIVPQPGANYINISDEFYKRMEEIKKEQSTQNLAQELEFVDFAVTARKYKTLLTEKYKKRKFWEGPSPYEIQSFIPGTIIQVFVKEGRVVKEGQPLLILEAMKMQNKIDMPFTAKIKKINVKQGEKIPKDFLMIELEPVK